jgi:hypothetical protein
VDFSEEMLRLTDETLKDITLRKNYICGDVASKGFRNEIARLTRGVDIRIFAFL